MAGAAGFAGAEVKSFHQDRVAHFVVDTLGSIKDFIHPEKSAEQRVLSDTVRLKGKLAELKNKRDGTLERPAPTSRGPSPGDV